MPLFGSSKKSGEKSNPQGYGGPYNGSPQVNPYHPQSNPYPQAGAYPAQMPTASAPYPSGPPPPYAPSSGPSQPPPQYYPPQGNAYPTASSYPMMGGPGPMGGAPPMYQQTPQTVYLADALDSGARVGPMSSQSIPPPPPGCPPNQAQMAAMQGHNVVLGQKKDNWFTGGTGGGYTWW